MPDRLTKHFFFYSSYNKYNLLYITIPYICHFCRIVIRSQFITLWPDHSRHLMILFLIYDIIVSSHSTFVSVYALILYSSKSEWNIWIIMLGSNVSNPWIVILFWFLLIIYLSHICTCSVKGGGTQTKTQELFKKRVNYVYKTV